MIDVGLIERAAGELLAAEFGTALAWANKDFMGARPYVVAQIVTAEVTDATLIQSDPVWRGLLMVTAVTALDLFEAQGRALLVRAGSLFPAASRISLIGGGSLVVAGHPQELGGYRDGADYRQPMRISLRTEF